MEIQKTNIPEGKQFFSLRVSLCILAIFDFLIHSACQQEDFSCKCSLSRFLFFNAVMRPLLNTLQAQLVAAGVFAFAKKIIFFNGVCFTSQTLAKTLCSLLILLIQPAKLKETMGIKHSAALSLATFIWLQLCPSSL